ncbi:MAG: tetratricopeptide repeat protein, partial [Candidatus Binatia bacterium]
LHLFTLARFGKWQEILDAPAIDSSLVYSSAMASYARGMALAGLDRADEAEKELRVVAKTAKDPEMKTFSLVSVGSTGADLLSVAALVLEGEIATTREDWKTAIRAFEAGVVKQDGLTYSEPPPWYFPIRDALGRAYLGAGKPAEAEKVYRKQLEITPRNGWSLYGLKTALAAQNKKELAAEVDRQFDKAWQRADVEITASVF